MRHYSIEPRWKEYVKGYGFLSFMRNPTDKHKKMLDTATKTGLDAVKTASKILVHKTTRGNYRKQNCWKNYETKLYICYDFKKCWRSCFPPEKWLLIYGKYYKMEPYVISKFKFKQFN